MRLTALYLEAFFAVLAARLATRMMRFSAVARRLGWQKGAMASPDNPAAAAVAARVGRAVTQASRILWLKDACLAEAIAAKWMLARRGEVTTLYIGLRVRGKAKVSPPAELLDHAVLHAWLNAGAQPVVGEKNVEYTVLEQYV